jgi:hypothetical protein
MALIGKKMKGVADLVFCVDCTGSMAPCIDGLKSELHRFISEMEAPPEQGLLPVDWRLRVIGFRDLFQDEQPWVNAGSPMVSTAAEARTQVDALVSDGGGDEPESALDGLWTAVAKTPWRKPCNRIVIFFSDASSLAKMHPTTVADGAAGDDVSAVAQALAEAGCRVHAWAPTCEVWDNLKCLPKVIFTPLQTGGDGLASLNFRELMENLRRTVSQVASVGQGFDGGTVALP